MIAILAPYNRGEATCAAIRLANLVVAHGGEVRLVSTTNTEIGVHSYWDQRVWSGKGDGIYFASRSVQTFIHFQPNATLREMTELISEKAQHVLVPQWHHLKADDAALIPDHHAIVCPSRRGREGVKAVAFNGVEPETVLSWANWDAGIPFVTREGLVSEGGNPKVLFLANHTVVDSWGRQTVGLIDELLGQLPKLTVTLACNKSWGDDDKREIRRLKDTFAERFNSVKLQGWDHLNKELHAHDWTVLPWTRSDFGITAARSLSCGAPVIAHDIEPFSEIITNEKNGLLLPCGVKCSPYQAPTAIPDFDAALQTMIPAFRDNRMLFRMQSQDWNLDGLEREFNKFWARLLGLAEPE